jgi:hypothetical protein
MPLLPSRRGASGRASRSSYGCRTAAPSSLPSCTALGLQVGEAAINRGCSLHAMDSTARDRMRRWRPHRRRRGCRAPPGNSPAAPLTCPAPRASLRESTRAVCVDGDNSDDRLCERAAHRMWFVNVWFFWPQWNSKDRQLRTCEWVAPATPPPPPSAFLACPSRATSVVYWGLPVNCQAVPGTPAGRFARRRTRSACCRERRVGRVPDDVHVQTHCPDPPPNACVSKVGS